MLARFLRDGVRSELSAGKPQAGQLQFRIPAIPSPNSGRQRIRTHRVGIYRAAISSARNRRPLRRVLKELRESEAEKRP
jgi:hypothetical protein